MGDDKMGDFFLLLFIYYPLHFSKSQRRLALDQINQKESFASFQSTYFKCEFCNTG